MLQTIDFSIGFLIVLGCLFLGGITRGRWVSQKNMGDSMVMRVLALRLIFSYILFFLKQFWQVSP
jgi:vacuolar-type H+-ATPase subunit I/STV1